ncbi:MAG: T9SS type A sorting domain-containing protein [Bacteroidota bacterium]|nr:T9SS type A sorting domain-containing protein [Bacteroidota bacterium]
MKKIYSLSILLLSITLFKAQVNIVTTCPSASLSNGTTGLRAPNGTANHTSLRACYHVPASELSALTASIASFGFVLTNTLVNAPANGTLTVYLQNTNSSSYTLGTSWSTATVGMTQVFSGVYNIPQGSTATVIDFQFPSNFAYTPGNALYLAYEYVGAQFASGNAVYSAFTNSAVNCGATNTSPILPAVNTLSTTTFRPLFRFGFPNSFTNDAAVIIVNAPGKISQQTGLPHIISANIFNGSNITKNNINVDLTIVGTNAFTAAVNVPSLAAGASTIVLFPSYNPIVLGISQIAVSLANDQNNANNQISYTQSVTCDVIATGPASFAPTSYSAGVGFGAGSGVIYSKFSTATSQTLISAGVGISSGVSNIGRSVYAVVSNSTGVVLATSNTLVISNAELDQFFSFNFTPVNFTGGVLYYVGLAQMPGSPAYYPLGATLAPNASTLYVTQALAGGVLNPLTNNLGYFALEPRFISPCGGVGASEINNEQVASLSLQPNPAKDKVIILVSNSDKNMTLEIRNMLGQLVMVEKTMEEQNEINLSELKRGIYFVTLTKNKTRVTQKLIVE